MLASHYDGDSSGATDVVPVCIGNTAITMIVTGDSEGAGCSCPKFSIVLSVDFDTCNLFSILYLF